MGIDFIEVSGGNYESPQMLAAKDSTRKRRSLLHRLRRKSPCSQPSSADYHRRLPFLQNAMEDALSSGHLDLVGVARPFALVPDLAKNAKRHLPNRENRPHPNRRGVG